METSLKFPPHVKGPRDNCPACAALIGDNPHVKDPAKVFDLCEHSGLNYHALSKIRDGAKTKITYICQETDCTGHIPAT